MKPRATLGIILDQVGGGMPMVLGRVSDSKMLQEALIILIQDSELRAKQLSCDDPISSMGAAIQAKILRQLLDPNPSKTPTPCQVLRQVM